MTIELGDVVAEAHKGPLAAGGAKATTTEPAPAAVLFDVAEERLDGVGTAGVGLGAFGGPKAVLHSLDRRSAQRRRSRRGAHLPGGPALLPVLHGGDQSSWALRRGVGLTPVAGVGEHRPDG